MFKTIKENTSYELIEKKSKFIANIYYIESIEEAENMIKETKKKNYMARHNCFAFSVHTERGIVSKFSDDGEPSGTAGSPILNIITSKNLCNILIIVTRYFGGILLGTGGLVRAYTGTSVEALEKCEIIEKDQGLIAIFETIYPDLEKFRYYLKQNNINIIDIEYKENIYLKVEIMRNSLEKIIENKKDFNFTVINYEIICKKYICI